MTLLIDIQITMKLGDLVMIARQSKSNNSFRAWQKRSIYSKAKAENIPLSHPVVNKTYLIIDVVCSEMIDFIKKHNITNVFDGFKFVKCLASDGTCQIFPTAALEVLQ